MYSSLSGFLFTGVRCFADVTRIDFWHNDQQAAVYIEDQRFVLDEGETQLLRRWNAISTEAAIEDNTEFLLRQRADRFSEQRRLERMNRTRTGRKASTATKAPELPGNVICISTLKGYSNADESTDTNPTAA